MDRLPFGVPSLDGLLGGGLERGVITNVIGESGSGKTNVAMQALKACLNSGHRAIFVDTEGGFSVERFDQVCGRDKLGLVILVQPQDFDQQDNIIKHIDEKIVENSVGLVVLDSAVALYRLDHAENNTHRANQMLDKQLARLSRIARERNIPVLITNHVYSGFDTGKLEIVGGDVPKYWSKCLIRLEKLFRGARRMVLAKHRSRPEGENAVFRIVNEGLVDCEEKLFSFPEVQRQAEGSQPETGFVAADEVR